MRQRCRALTIAGYIFSVVSFGSIASAQDNDAHSSAQDNNTHVIIQKRDVVVIDSLYCSLTSTPPRAPCNPPCPPGGCPGTCISGQCIKEILK
jgi:hypothetical protein